MPFTRHANFAQHVRTQPDEAHQLGCPYCGHTTPDHRWTEPFNCLLCDCPGWELSAATDPSWTFLNGQVFTRADMPDFHAAVAAALADA